MCGAQVTNKACEVHLENKHIASQANLTCASVWDGVCLLLTEETLFTAAVCVCVCVFSLATCAVCVCVCVCVLFGNLRCVWHVAHNWCRVKMRAMCDTEVTVSHDTGVWHFTWQPFTTKAGFLRGISGETSTFTEAVLFKCLSVKLWARCKQNHSTFYKHSAIFT